MTETNVNSMNTGSVVNDLVTTSTKVKSFLDYTGLKIYTKEMLAWSGESLTKFEYTLLDRIPESPYISDEKLPRYIYMYDNDNDGTYDLYMYIINTDPQAPSGTTYKLTNIGSIALELEDYYTKNEIDTQLKDYVKNTDQDYLDLIQNAASAQLTADAAIIAAGEAKSAADGAVSTANTAYSIANALAGRVTKLEQDGVGGGCNCTAIEESSIYSLFAELD